MIKLFKICVFYFLNLFLINLCFAQIKLFHKIMPQNVVDESGEKRFVSADVKISVFNSRGFKFVEDQPIPVLVSSADKSGERRESVSCDSYGFPDDIDMSGFDKERCEGKILVCEKDIENELFLDMESIKNQIRIRSNEINTKFVEKDIKYNLNNGFVFPSSGDGFFVSVPSVKGNKKFYFNCLLSSKNFTYGVFFSGVDLNKRECFLSLHKLVNNKIGDEIARAFEVLVP